MSWSVLIFSEAEFVARYAPAEREKEERGDADALRSRLRYFSFVTFGREKFFVVEDAGRVLGVANCVISDAGELQLSYVTVDPGLPKRGIATSLVKAIRRSLDEIGQMGLPVSEYSTEGELYLKPIIEREIYAVESAPSARQQG